MSISESPIIYINLEKRNDRKLNVEYQLNKKQQIFSDLML